MTYTSLVGVTFDTSTIDPAGRAFLSDRGVRATGLGLDAGITRLRIDLPSDVPPEIFAEIINSVSVMSQLLSRVGARLGKYDFGTSGTSGTDTLVDLAGESSEFAIRRVQYGSEMQVYLAEMWPSGVTLATTAAAIAGGIAWDIRKNGSKVMSFLWTLADPKSRKIWVESHREELGATLEKRKNDASSQKLNRLQNEAVIRTLEIEAMDKETALSRILEIEDNHVREQILSALPELMPLLANGLIIESVAELEGENSI